MFRSKKINTKATSVGLKNNSKDSMYHEAINKDLTLIP